MHENEENSWIVVLFELGNKKNRAGKINVEFFQQGNGAGGGATMESDDPLGPLPEGWEKHVDTRDGATFGKVYFVNNFGGITSSQWEDPRIQG